MYALLMQHLWQFNRRDAEGYYWWKKQQEQKGQSQGAGCLANIIWLVAIAVVVFILWNLGSQ